MINRVQMVLGAAVLAVMCAATASASEWRVVDDHSWCRHRSGVKLCEVREVVLDAWDDVKVQTTNGGITVETWDRDEIRILAKVEVSRVSRDEAREIADEVHIRADEDGIYAKGPKSRGISSWFGGNRKWSVSYRITVPEHANVAAKTTNGGIDVSDVDGDIEAYTTNGGVTVVDAGGDIDGATTNGGIEVSVSADWKGDEIDLHTTNGGILIKVSREFSARVDASTTNGGIHVEHPITIESKSRHRLKGRLGDGDATLRLRTTNGGVDIARR